MFVALEGIDGSGKSTQINLITKKLNDRIADGTVVESVKFPVINSPTGSLIKKLLDSGVKSKESRIIFQSLMSVNRKEFFYKYSLHKKILIADRYELSGIVYGLAQGLDLDWLLSINQNDPAPDLTFFIDVDPSESFKRRPKREDQLESDIDFLQVIYSIYKKRLPLGSIRVDGMLSPDRIADEIVHHILSFNHSLTYSF